MSKEVQNYLSSLEISFQLFEHPPVYTCEEADKYCKDVRGIKCKNLFLKGAKTGSFYLAIISADKKLDLKKISKLVKDNLEFAQDSDLTSVLNLSSGAVSPFGLLNDKEQSVIVLISEEVWNSDYVGFHPNINTQTLELSSSGFHKFLASLGNKFYLI
ncbi:prolyl-tRNA synthetase associated domain-containing protein [Candidatus Pacearchaeota archaeon]|nr:prolyl-tRNA synthetase associated domain-containing protein [Candidatus Pacearchaeota archaeon]